MSKSYLDIMRVAQDNACSLLDTDCEEIVKIIEEKAEALRKEDRERELGDYAFAATGELLEIIHKMDELTAELARVTHAITNALTGKEPE